jgi:hypothetical protein
LRFGHGYLEVIKQEVCAPQDKRATDLCQCGS